MKAHEQPTPWELTHALDTARRGGCVIQIALTGHNTLKLYSVADVADMLQVHSGWVRVHLEEFPGKVRLPGGDIRIPIADIQAALERWREGFPDAARKRLEMAG